MTTPRAVVIGGGIVGLAAARALAADGWRVVVLERHEPGREAAFAAAGMLAPQLEFDEHHPLHGPSRRALALYPEFAAALEEASGHDVGLLLNGIVAPLSDAEAESRYDSDGARRLSGDEARRLEPSLSDNVPAALFYRDTGSVDNRRVVTALRIACERSGVEIRSQTPALEVLVESGRVVGVRSPSGNVPGDAVVNCAGAWASEISPREAPLDVRPVKGQMLLLETDTPPRHVVYSHLSYIVPRCDGRVVIGTTMEDRGYDKSVEAWAIADLLHRAITICPSLRTARLVDSWAGLRPRTPNALPQVEAIGPDGYVVATGHYRNGILLAPLAALTVAKILRGVPVLSASTNQHESSH